MSLLGSALNTLTFGAFKGKEMPGLGPQNVDMRTDELINQQAARVPQTNEQEYGQSMENVDRSADLANAQSNIEAQNRALGGQDHEAFSEALRQRAQKSYGLDLNKIERQARAQAPVSVFQKQQQALTNKQKQYQYQQEYVNMQRQKDANDKAARNQVIGSVLGLGGTIAGTALGGPAGGMAGGAAGKAVAQGVG